jgi:hypothetical protein
MFKSLSFPRNAAVVSEVTDFTPDTLECSTLTKGNALFSAYEMPCDFMLRASEVAYANGDRTISSLFLAFSNEWGSVESEWSSEPALSWRLAKITPTGRAALSLATEYVDIKEKG